MSNIDRAAKVILNHRGGTWSTSVETAHALADAGLLAPELPQPNPEHDDYTDFGNVWIEHDEPQRIYTDIDDLTPEEAEALGLALLAAAQHTREQA